jgi:type IV secretory pathway TrbL component
MHSIINNEVVANSNNQSVAFNNLAVRFFDISPAFNLMCLPGIIFTVNTDIAMIFSLPCLTL